MNPTIWVLGPLGLLVEATSELLLLSFAIDGIQMNTGTISGLGLYGFTVQSLSPM